MGTDPPGPPGVLLMAPLTVSLRKLRSTAMTELGVLLMAPLTVSLRKLRSTAACSLALPTAAP